MPRPDDRRFTPLPGEPDWHDRATPTEPALRVPDADDSRDGAHSMPMPADSERYMRHRDDAPPRPFNGPIMVVAQLAIIVATVFVTLVVQDCRHEPARSAGAVTP